MENASFPVSLEEDQSPVCSLWVQDFLGLKGEFTRNDSNCVSEKDGLDSNHRAEVAPRLDALAGQENRIFGNLFDKSQHVGDRELTVCNPVKQSKFKNVLLKKVKDGLGKRVAVTNGKGWKIKGKGRWVRKVKLKYAPTQNGKLTIEKPGVGNSTGGDVNSSSSSSVGLKGHKGHRQFLYGECSSKNQKHVTSSCGGSSDKERRQSMDVIKDSGSTTNKSEATKIGCLEKRGSKCSNDVGKKCISESLGCSKSIRVFGSQDGSSGGVAVSGDQVVFINFDKDRGVLGSGLNSVGIGPAIDLFVDLGDLEPFFSEGKVGASIARQKDDGKG